MISCRDLVVDAQVPLAEVQDEMEQRDERDPAGGLAGAEVPEAVGDDHCEPLFVEPLPDHDRPAGWSELFPGCGRLVVIR